MDKGSRSESYEKAGVDIRAGYRAVELMKKHVLRTTTPGCIFTSTVVIPRVFIPSGTTNFFLSSFI